LRLARAREGLAVELILTSEQVALIAEQVAEILPTRQNGNGDGWLRGADKIAAYIDAPVSRVYSLSSAGRIPVERDGSNLIARRSELDSWLRNGGSNRP
jgi:hypothetical protein